LSRKRPFSGVLPKTHALPDLASDVLKGGTAGSAFAVRSREATTGLSIWIETAVLVGLVGLIAALFGEVLQDLAYE
jgi:hypothetical protein